MISQLCIGDPTDEYVARCGVRHWGFSKSVELSERINRLKASGKQYAFTERLRSFVIRADHDMLVSLMCAWGRSGPFYDETVKTHIKRLMGE